MEVQNIISKLFGGKVEQKAETSQKRKGIKKGIKINRLTSPAKALELVLLAYGANGKETEKIVDKITGEKSGGSIQGTKTKHHHLQFKAYLEQLGLEIIKVK